MSVPSRKRAFQFRLGFGKGFGLFGRDGTLVAATVELASGASISGVDRALAIARVEGLGTPVLPAVDSQIGWRKNFPL